VLFSPTTNGSVIKNFNFKPGGIHNQLFSEIHLLDNNPSGLVQTRQMKDDSIQLDVDESPVILLMN